MIDPVAAHILALPAWVALLVVFALPALESSAFVGFVFPGEIALVLGGVLASQHRVPFAAVLASGVLGAVVGDSVGYAVGRRYGQRVLDGALGRWVRRDHMEKGRAYLTRRGGRTVFLGRFTAALRVMVPGLAGMARLPYRTFLVYNVAGGVAWGTLSVSLGYLGGASWRHVAQLASRTGLVVLAVIVVGMAGGHLLRRLSRSPLLLTWARLSSTRPVRGFRSRFPRTAAWVTARSDPRSRSGLGLTVSVAVAVVAIWLFLGITQDVVAREELARLDPRLHAWVLRHRSAVAGGFFGAVTWLGASVVTVPMLVGAGVLLRRRRRTWRPLLQVAAVYGVTVLLRAVIADLVHRSRPPMADWLMPVHGWAYPSGHTTQAVTAFGLIVWCAWPHVSARLRWAMAAAATLLSGLVAASRVYLGVHWLSDVLGAGALSVAALAAWDVAHRSVAAPTASRAGPRTAVRHRNGLELLAVRRRLPGDCLR